jgi:hypothetical protein
MMCTFDARNANAPSRHHTQYFEMMGDNAIYHDGWIASTSVMRPQWDVSGAVPTGFIGWTSSRRLVAQRRVDDLDLFQSAAKAT